MIVSLEKNERYTIGYDRDRLVSQLVERRQSLEHLEKESNIIIAKTESLKKKIHGAHGNAGHPLPTTKVSFVYLDASAHLYESVCLSVGRTVGRSVRRYVRPEHVKTRGR